MIWKDEIVEEVRRVREEHAAKFNFDISAICADIRRKQAESGRQIVSFGKGEGETDQEKSDVLKAV